MPDEKACLKELGASARRDGRQLTLGLANGKTKVISDAKECEDENQEASCITYRLVGRLGEQYYIVMVAPYECAYITLVNRKSGTETELGGWPRLSPDKTRFVVIEPREPGNCDTKYAIAIFSLIKGSVRLDWQYKPDGFELYDFDTWNGGNRLQLQATGADGKQVASDLTRTAPGWQLKRPNGEVSLGTPTEPAQAKPPNTPAGR
ncbi:hypothetical protein [Bradyrhizobium sp. STM 3557]|uniref:hypothetical protein n=1 Tax=Bradyrhizobium sp. STM 3557 TaxID=578920 RepID=UPI003891013E